MNSLPRVGITCYPTQGGSGILASELGLNLARSGLEVHFITSSMPVRLRAYEGRIFHHSVDVATYPVFQYPPYTLSLATRMSEVAVEHGLDILHVHYAIPHAASAFLAREMVGADRLKVVTTLHGTDITLVGQEPNYFPITRFMIERSDAVTTVSHWLRGETERVFGIRQPIEVIPNFVDPCLFKPRENDEERARHQDHPGQKLVLHASNFRKVKNIPAVMEVFAGLAARCDCRLLLVGEGPELPTARELAERAGLRDRVTCLGQVEDMSRILPVADLLLLPSLHESFGLVALEAMSSGVPVIATSEGGAREFVVHGSNGFLHAPQDMAGMTASGRAVLSDGDLAAHMGEEARRDVSEEYGAHRVMKKYLALYDRLLGRAGADAAQNG